MDGASSSKPGDASSTPGQVRKPSKFKPALSNLTNKKNPSYTPSSSQKPAPIIRTHDFIDLSSDSSPSSPTSLKRDSSELSISAVISPPLKKPRKTPDHEEASSTFKMRSNHSSNETIVPRAKVAETASPIVKDLSKIPLETLNHYKEFAMNHFMAFANQAFDAMNAGDMTKDMELLDRLRKCACQRRDEIEAAINIAKLPQAQVLPPVPPLPVTRDTSNARVVDPGPSRGHADPPRNAVANVNTQLPTPSSAVDDDQILWDNLECIDISMDDDYPVTRPNSAAPPPAAAVVADLVCSAEPPALRNSPYYRELKAKLHQVFGLQDFRMNQLEAVTAAMEGRDVFVLMPTGGGKSLCYQLPSVCESGHTSGLTIVISPLISLMKDQVRALVEKGVKAFCSTSEEYQNERALVHDARLWYITPEKLRSSPGTRALLGTLYAQGKLARFVIDEAHCISTWGQDFREAYTFLGEIRRDYSAVPIMALTATANAKTVADIVSQLKLRNHVSLSQSFNRPNLQYYVRRKERGKNFSNDMIETIKTRFANQTGIIYCTSRKTCQNVAKKLQDNGLSAAFYHAGMPPEDKDKTTHDWQNNTIKTIVATIAFGMGIDKPDVRYVIHYDMPKTLSGYYQETGRAGRDRKLAECIMYYSYKDVSDLLNMIRKDDNATVDSIRRQSEAVREVFRFCENPADCRRVLILNHFDEKFDPKDCNGGCDTCVEPPNVVSTDVRKQAVNTIELVQSFEAQRINVTESQIQEILRRSQKKDVMAKGWDSLPQYGVCSDMNMSLFETMLNRLLLDEVLAKHSVINGGGFHNEYIKVGDGYHDFMRKQEYIARWRDRSSAATGAFKRRNQFNEAESISAPAPRSRKGKDKAPEIEADPIEMYADDSEEDTPVTPIVGPSTSRYVAPPVSMTTRTARVPSAPAQLPVQREASPVAGPAPRHRPATHQSSGEVEPDTERYQQMQDLRSEILIRDDLQEENDVFSNEVLEMLALMCPVDFRGFIEVLTLCGAEEEEAQANFMKYGQPFLDLCLKSKYAPAGPSRPVAQPQPFTPAVLHSRFDYRPPAPHNPSNNNTPSGVTIRTNKFKPARS